MRNAVVGLVQFVVVLAVMGLAIWATVTYLVENAEVTKAWICQHPMALAVIATLVILDYWYIGSRDRYLAQRRSRRNRENLAAQLVKCRPAA